MGKISNAIKMLNYLNTGNKYTANELAEKLRVTPRMVRYYKNELEIAGISIESFMGPNGGYYAVNNNPEYNLFNKYDIELLEEVYEFIKNSDYKFCDKYRSMINKVKHINEINSEKSKYFFDNDYEDPDDLYKIIKEAINSKSKLKIIYEDLSQDWQERVINPIQIFKYKNEYYVTAYCELRKDIRHFEFKRIKINKK